MRRAIFVALGIGAIVSSAAGITATAMPEGSTGPERSVTFLEMKIAEASARASQRERIDSRYQSERGHCASLGGTRHDRCLIAAHAHRGRALLEAAAPYQARD